MKPAPRHPIHLALGLAIWIIWFGAIYGGLSLACVTAPPSPSLGPYTWVNGVLLLSTVAVVLLLAYLAWRCWYAPGIGDERERHARRLVARVSAGLYIAAAIATLGVGLPMIVLPPCL